MNHFKIIIISAIFSLHSIGMSQALISLDDAIIQALKNNYDIQLADNSVELAKTNKNILNTGFLPTVSASASGNYSNTNNTITNQQNVETSVSGVATTSMGGDVTASYIIYNGGKRKHNFKKLKNQYLLTSVQKQQQIDNTLLNVYTTYFNIAKNSLRKNILTESFKISKERLARIEVKNKYGQNTNLDVLNARVDANNDSINLVNADLLLFNSKRMLNFLLARDINTIFNVEESTQINLNMSYDSLLAEMINNNYQLKMNELNQTINKNDLKINQSSFLPSISTNLRYSVNSNDNGPVGFFRTQNSNGFSSGLNLNWNLFDGGTTKTRVKNAKINILNQEIAKKQLQLNLRNELLSNWIDYTNQKGLIDSEKLNVEVNNQNFLKTKERFNLGQVTSTDFRQAQLNLLNTKVSLINAQFNAKLAEIKLKKLAGTLLK